MSALFSAGVNSRARNEIEVANQGILPLIRLHIEYPLRKLETMDERSAELRRKRSAPGDDQFALYDRCVNVLMRDAWQGHENKNFVDGFQDINRELPSGAPVRIRKRKYLTLHPLGAREHFEGL